LETRFEFTHLTGTFLVERNILLDSTDDGPTSGTPLWHLSRAGVGIVNLPELPSDTREAVAARFADWLREHYYETSHLGIAYQFYRIPGDFWRLDKQFPEPPGAWEVRREGEHVTQFPESEADGLEAAVAFFAREMAEEAALVECFGGPLDGQRIGERGDSFRPTEKQRHELEERRAPRSHQPQQGQYRRTKRGYDWAPD
jgi:hypothetical protein